MVECDRSGEILILQIEIKGTQCCGHGECFVGDQAGGKRWHVEALDLGGAMLHFTARQIQLAFIVIRVPSCGFAQQQVLNVRTSAQREFAKRRRIYGRLTPTDDSNATAGEDFHHEIFDLRVACVLASRKEKSRYGEVFVRDV